MAQSKGKAIDVELRPDGWERFKMAVSAAAKAGPQHRPAKKQAKKSKARASK